MIFSLIANARNIIGGLPDSDLVCKNGTEVNCGFVAKSDNIAVLASSFAQIMTYIIGATVIIFILYGAFIWMTGGEKGPENGKKMITNALIALIIATAAYGIVATIIGFLNTTTVGGDGQTTQNQTTPNTTNNPAQTTNPNPNQNTQTTKPKAQNPSNNQPIQNNNPQNNQNTQNTQTKPTENPKVETPKSQNTNQTNQNLLEDPFTLPTISPPNAPQPSK